MLDIKLEILGVKLPSTLYHLTCIHTPLLPSPLGSFKLRRLVTDEGYTIGHLAGGFIGRVGSRLDHV